MTLIAIINICSAVCGLVAAALWFVSARFNTPASFSIHVASSGSHMELPLGGDPLDGKHIGQAYSQDLVDLAGALRNQSKYSGYAASFAGIAAIMQALALFVGRVGA